HPCAGRQRYCYPVTPRLACVKPVASVHPEPGSNSSLYEKFLKILSGLNSNLPQRNYAFLSFLFRYCINIFKDRYSLHSAPCQNFLESGCKDKSVFSNFQNKFRFFIKNLFFQFSYSPKAPLFNICTPHRFESGCKDKGEFPMLPNLSTLLLC